jgi:CRP/FNR family cyclic AMP-dependent transcriptional regulator
VAVIPAAAHPFTTAQHARWMRGASWALDYFENCITCKWRSEKFFCNLDAKSLKDLDHLTFTNVYPPGAVLFGEGQNARGMYLVCRGSVKQSISAGDGKTLIVHIAAQGDVLGLSSVITGNPHKTTAETLEPSQVNFIRREDFLRFLHTHHEACANAAQQLSRECEADIDHIRAIGLSHSAAEKLAHLLLTWCNQSGKETEAGTRLQLLMTHEDISQLIGTSRETVTRLLKEFREKNIISVRGSTLCVLNKAALEALVML